MKFGLRPELRVGLALLPLCACTPAYPKLPPLPDNAPPFTTADAAFLQQANEHDLTQIALAKLTVDHARSNDVKTLGQDALKDYEAHRKTLSTLAGKHDLALTTTVLAADQEKTDRLSKLHGPAFDRAYMKAIRDDAQANQASIGTVFTTTKDSDVKAAATDLQKLDQRYISSAFSWLPQLATRKHRSGTHR
ncbi:DUF4142 domain-containing protein [Asaia sp. HumB]|uniref:DUF4142 domain-containing protein n=1 Tax=Asaia sp. HumB TaxID=3035475 RepID=UPI002557AB78|nr:DUF4142 domain-containing protein [Asaia sp. HumB]MDL2172008.1 DUF4142 domain-containing protein [Asaia sp. HumB]